MRLKTILGCSWILVLLLSVAVQAGEPGSDQGPVIEKRTQEAVPAPAMEPAPAPVAEAAPGGNGRCTVTCYRPVWRTRDINCTRRVCKYRDETRTCKYPVYVPEQQTRTVICWKTECVTEMHTMTQCCNTVDECGRCCPQVVTCEVPVQVPRRVPYEVEQTYTVCVCQWQEREYTVQVPYWDTEEFTCQQQYCEMEPYEVEVPPCNPCCTPCCAPVCANPCGPACGPLAAVLP